VLFWRDRWIEGRSAHDIAPALSGKVRTRAYNAKTVAQALTENRWVLDISGVLTDQEARECIRLWLAIGSMEREIDSVDRFLWPWTQSGVYTARSTYRMLTHGSCTHPLG
jgi:hypothetical protein